uniref:NADH dehydrogenase [ubiquinone] 1 alpha subcomplex subunit 3-like isoform X2 n=1 Tax=Myxine glutinosa TaxID=7769 RepID=UPI00358FE840
MLGRMGVFFRNAWNKEPVITASIGISVVVILPFISPYMKYTSMVNDVTPFTYPVPVRDDGNMPDVPSHPCDKVGRTLDWMKS